jgi:hypothetical protein
MKRLLPIDTPQREAAVAQACCVAIGPHDSVKRPAAQACSEPIVLKP